jgi:hypothetical protein
MSARPDFGFEVQEFKRLPDGKYDMDQWNDEYWTRFHNLLTWCHERDIIIQIEIWDRFDYSRGHWQTSPWNPANNVNYTYAQTGFAADYPAHPGQNQQPFFFTIPGMSKYTTKLDVVREYQERRVAKMLSYSLKYPNVLYCMNNETSGSPEWGRHWMKFVRTHAAEEGVEVYATDMFDDVYRPQQSEKLRLVIDNPEIYPFLDISQNNSRNYDEDHWNNLLWISHELNSAPRPMNNTKIYGSGYKGFGTGGPEDGVERFWRNLLGGCASSRFHRPDSGNGLNDLAKASIQAARLLETKLKFWDVTPHMELLAGREPNEAYLAAQPGKCYALYFPYGGEVTLDLSGAPGSYEITWISVSMGRILETSSRGRYGQFDKTVEGGRTVTLSAPYKGGWVAAFVKQ